MIDLGRSRVRLAGVALICARVALVPLVFDSGVEMPFVVPKALLGHALAYALAAVLIALFIRFGQAVIVRSRLHLPVLAYLAVAVLATIFAENRYLSVFGTHERMIGLATILDWAVLYFAIVCLVRSRSDAIAVGASVFGASLVMLGYEVVQVTGNDPWKWSIEGVDRAFSGTGQPNSLGQYASTLAVGAFASGVLLPRLQRVARAAMLALAGALIWGAAATDSRAPIVGLGAAAFLLVATIWWTRRGTNGGRLAALAGVVAVGVLAALFVLTPIGARMAFTLQATGDENIFARVDESTAGRLALYGIGIGEVLERPLLGYGPDNFVAGIPRYRQDPAPFAIRQSMASSAHSWIVQTAATMGLLGLFALLGVFLTAAYLVIRSGFAPVPLIAAAALTAQLGTGATTIDDLSTGWITWFLLGVIGASTASPMLAAAAAPASRKGRRRATAAARESPLRVGAAALVLAVGGVLMLTPLSAYSAAHSSSLSTASRLSGRTADAVRFGLSATADDPSRGPYWHALALAYVSAGRLADAADAFDRANTLSPYTALYPNDLIQIDLVLAQNGDAKAKVRGIELADAVAKRDPNNPRSHLSRAQAQFVAGNVSESAVAIRRALALDPDSKNVDLYRTATQILGAAGRYQEAVDVARRGIAVLGPTQTLKDLRDALDRALAALGQPPDPRADPNACTSTRWEASPFGGARPGTSVNFAVAAGGCEAAESQMTVLAPDATTPVVLKDGSWNTSFTWDTRGLAPGRYRIVVYTRRTGWTGPYQAFYEDDYAITR